MGLEYDWYVVIFIPSPLREIGRGEGGGGDQSMGGGGGGVVEVKGAGLVEGGV